MIINIIKINFGIFIPYVTASYATIPHAFHYGKAAATSPLAGMAAPRTLHVAGAGYFSEPLRGRKTDPAAHRDRRFTEPVRPVRLRDRARCAFTAHASRAAGGRGAGAFRRADANPHPQPAG